MTEYYNTQEVIRQCAVPGMLVIYNSRTFTVKENADGKIKICRIAEQYTLTDLLIRIVLQ